MRTRACPDSYGREAGAGTAVAGIAAPCRERSPTAKERLAAEGVPTRPTALSMPTAPAQNANATFNARSSSFTRSAPSVPT